MRKRRYTDETGAGGRRYGAGAEGRYGVGGEGRRAQADGYAQTQQHVRRNASLDLDEGFVDPIGSARSYRNAQASGSARRVQAPSYRGAAQMRDATYAPSRNAAPGSAQAEYEDYRARQMQMHSRDAARYHARPSGLEASSEKVSRKPALVIGLAVVCVVLLLVFVVRVPMLMGTLSKAGEAGAALSEQQAQLDELKGANEQLQQSVDSMQSTIDAYNAKK